MGPCMCGDLWCPSCGPAQGNMEAAPGDPGDLPTHCEACGKLMIEDEGGTIYLCSACVLKIHGIVFPKGGTSPHCETHKEFEYDCIDCSDALRRDK